MRIVGGRQQGTDAISRRGFLHMGALGGGLTLAELLRLKANGSMGAGSSNKAIIMVYLNGGPSHIDMYDPKPAAPAEYRGEFRPIKTNVPGVEFSEMLPLQAKIADKLSITRNMKFPQRGPPGPELSTGFLKGDGPSIGSVVSKPHADARPRRALPSYV